MTDNTLSEAETLELMELSHKVLGGADYGADPLTDEEDDRFNDLFARMFPDLPKEDDDGGASE